MRPAIFFLTLIIILLIFVFDRLPVKAEYLSLASTIPSERLKPFIVTSTDGLLTFIAKAGTSTSDLPFQLFTLYPREEIANNFPVAEGLIPVSDLFVLALSSVNSSSTLADFNPQIIFKYTNDNRLRNLYIWDPLSNAFIKLAAVKDLKRPMLTYNVPDYGQFVFALFEEKELVGKSSWYVHPRYRNELMAASTQFMRGSKVKVTNLDNNKSVVVTVKDWGPDPILHPDRVIDLNKIAFKRIASTRQGVINVKVEPYIVTSTKLSLE